MNTVNSTRTTVPGDGPTAGHIIVQSSEKGTEKPGEWFVSVSCDDGVTWRLVRGVDLIQAAERCRP